MPENLYSKQVDSVGYDNLFGSMPGHDIHVKSVTLKSGQGVLKRGTVIGIITATKKGVTVNKANADGSQTADSILTDDADTTAGDVVVTAYASGTFNRAALTFGGTDTAADHETRLRELGIFLKENIAY
ncbi:head decoration protein [Gorillibacterium sp. sgz5001074]|uniref:head decoration protein n=1 Tax=Gorillibacterium sp. sgz5001074 TaxID=3446695 RepID=UPI003F677A19